MVRPVSLKGFQKGFQGVSLRGFRGFQIFLWELCVCIKYLSLGDPCCGTGGFLLAAYEHMREKGPEGAPLRELQQDLPGHNRSQIQVLLRELRNENRAYFRGNTSAAKWFAGPSPAEDS